MKVLRYALVLVAQPRVLNHVQRLLRHGTKGPRGVVGGAEAVGEREDARLHWVRKEAVRLVPLVDRMMTKMLVTCSTARGSFGSLRSGSTTAASALRDEDAVMPFVGM